MSDPHSVSPSQPGDAAAVAVPTEAEEQGRGQRDKRREQAVQEVLHDAPSHDLGVGHLMGALCRLHRLPSGAVVIQ
ncbi:MAG: hypothetical protein HOY79_19500 [Streptomyces sp.]|nr:hypothetical protein [Streptomyces sp.]